MYWADEIAEKIIETYPNAEHYTCASGISPSGVVHMGNLREVVTSYFVVKALRDKGKKVRFIFSWDNYDRLRKVPADVDESFHKYIGMPLDEAPDPYGCHTSWARHFQQPFIDALANLGIEIEHINQSEQYKSGKYLDGMLKAIQKRKEIYDINYSFKTQEGTEEERNAYYPIEIYCSKCGKDTTKVLSDSDNGAILEYECKCGHKHSMDLRKEHNAKLVWKVDWPMRWVYENVLFEPGGKDHSSEGGSAQVASVIVDKIYNGKPPIYVGYEFIGIKGVNGKMSSSKGNVMSPEMMLKVYPPEIILWLYTRYLPSKAFDISLDDEVLRMYHEFDRMYALYESGEADEIVKRIMELALSCRGENTKVCKVSAQTIASFAPIVNFDLSLLVTLLNKIGVNCTEEEIEDRFNRVTYWLKNYCPEQITVLLENKNTSFYESLNEDEKDWIKRLLAELDKELSVEEIQALLYEIPKINGEPDKARQKRFFEIVYNLLIGKNKGPRLYLFLAALDKTQITKLLDF